MNKFHEKMFDFVSFPLFGFTLVKKLRNFDFENHWNTLKPKNFGGKTSAENFSDRFYNVGKNFGPKKCDWFGQRAVFKG